MKKRQAAKLHEEWIAQGNKVCIHDSLKLLMTDAGYLTGKYGCQQCGAEVEMNMGKRAKSDRQG
jgi:hypothetical protein